MSKRHKHMIAMAAVLAPLLGSGGLTAQSAEKPEIAVTGNGSATFIPDRVTVVIEVRTEAATASEAAARNTPLMEAVLDTLSRTGYGPDNVKTRGYTVQPTYRYDPSGPAVSGYAATNAVTVRMARVSALGGTLDAVLAAGATRVGSVRFETTDQERVRREALERAVAAARQDGEAIARAAGGAVGELISISTDARPTREEFVMAAATTSFQRGETPINPGEQTIVATVQVRWQFIKR